ncbi:MAG: hypothetical protein OdinLCB4_000100 [Candidatus Odinarchaeum yellowstonii]|jgi:hypothetical protein|uniref:Uncharacterized protein n=1 Tax=Odinarchaeota yellowstonii (strain LCB_4) TaxID=1841599 RepID=A0AAF0D292_ODILC|nr:MAG: hypothetical protein OdinLCB4_000100 [Candidatus Odinarchaeum yellowstonii]
MGRQIYCITEEGELKSVSELGKDSCAIIIDTEEKIIYTAIPDNAPVRERFITARLAAELKRANGLVYKIQSIPAK